MEDIAMVTFKHASRYEDGSFTPYVMLNLSIKASPFPQV